MKAQTKTELVGVEKSQKEELLRNPKDSTPQVTKYKGSRVASKAASVGVGGVPARGKTLRLTGWTERQRKIKGRKITVKGG